MSFAIIDKNTKEVIQGGFNSENDALDALIDNAPDENEVEMYDIVKESTTPEDRDAYFADHKGLQQIARMFPNLAEQYMNGNRGFNFDNIKAGISDSFSLPGRFIGTAGDSDWSNLGRRSNESDNLGGKMLRDPMTLAGILSGGILGKGVQLGANAGSRVAAWAAKNAQQFAPYVKGFATAGKYAGATATGAAEGAGMTMLGNELNGTSDNPAFGAATGVVFEGAGQVAASLMRHFGKNLVLESVAALKLGNAKAARDISAEEVEEFCRDPRNMDALVKFLKQQSSGTNLFPSKDRGKTLEPAIVEARDKAANALNGDKMLSPRNVARGNDVAEDQLSRRLSLSNSDADTENYVNKTLSKPQTVDKNSDMIYAEESVQGAELPWKTNTQAHVEQMVGKYNEVDKAIKDLPVNPSLSEMTPEEKAFIEAFKANDVGKDIETLGAMHDGFSLKDYAIKHDYFAGNYNPFDDKLLMPAVKKFRDGLGGNGVSQQFKKNMDLLCKAMNRDANLYVSALQNELNGLEKGIGKALSYAKSEPYRVKKGYGNAVDKFADDLNDYVDSMIGVEGKNSENKIFINTSDKFSKYAYNYLYKIQDVLQNRQQLDPDFIVALYGQATNANDAFVQGKIIELLKNIGLDDNRIKEFERVGGTYAMLNKARTRAKSKIEEDGMLKGTVLAPIEPKKGLNAANAWGYRLQGGNLNLGNLNSNFNNPTKVGTALRSTLYGVAEPSAKYNLGK